MAQSTDDRGNNSRALHNLIRSPDGIVVPVMDLGNIFAWCNEIEAKALADVSPAVIAAVGRPSAPVFPPLLAAVREYWATQSGDAIGYGALSGGVDDRARMAAALAKVYGVPVPVESVVFTVGGHHAIAATMAAYRQLYLHSSAPAKFVVSALPFYPAHCGWASNRNRMLFADILDEGTFTAAALERALDTLADAATEVGMVAFCSPNNPLGYVIPRAEWCLIADVLRARVPEAIILLDEAYMEMAFEHGGSDSDSGPSWFPSLFACAPDLHQRTVLIRSATKGFSASGERYGVAVVGSPRLRELMISYIHESSIHAPRSGQFAYSRAMEQFDAAAAAKLQQHYRVQVDRARTALRESNLLWANPKYRVQGGFYLIIDLSRLRGRKLHARANAVFVASGAAAAAAGGAREEAAAASPTIDTDVHAVFHLMFAHGLAIAPMSLYGVDPHRMLLRVTCSCATSDEEEALLARLARVAAECNASA